MSTSDRNDLVGTRLAHYRLCTPLGSGGMGTVYRAWDERLHRDVAVKVLSNGFADGDVRRSLVDEARILSRLNHANIGAVYDVDSAAGRDFLVLEYVPGLTLEELLATGPLEPAEVVRLGVQMTRALSAAHAAAIVHRDIKPANIRITPSGELKLLDFGVAKLLCEAMTPVPVSRTTGRRVAGPFGTVPYMSPEQLRGGELDARSDVFSAGAVLYQMATGQPPFPQPQLACVVDAVLNQDPVRPRAINLGIPAALERVVLKSLRKRPQDRYESAVALGNALESALANAPRVGLRLTSSARRWWEAVRGGPRRVAAGA